MKASSLKKIDIELPLWVATNTLLDTSFTIPDDFSRNVKCPFHGDDTPSMRLFEDGLGYCFGCGKQYSGFDAILYYTGYDYKETFHILKTVFNIEIKKNGVVEVEDNEFVKLTKEFLSKNDISVLDNRFMLARALTRCILNKQRGD